MKNLQCKSLIYAVIILMFLSINFSYAQQPIQTLELNNPIERQIKGGETQTFEFDVKAGFYARAEVEQKNIDVIVSLFAPDGKLVVEMDGKNGELWREAVSSIAEKDGAYRVEIKAYGATDAAGSYTIKLAELRSSAPNDRKRLEAEAHLGAGRKLYVQGEAKFQEAVKEYEAAVVLWRELGENEWEAVTLLNLGWTDSDLSKNEQAIAAHTRAITLFQKTKDRIGEGKAVNGLGNVYKDLEQFEKAENYYEQALIIRRETKNRSGESSTLNNLGIVYYNLGEYKKAVSYYEQVLNINRETKNRGGESSTLMSLGRAYDDLSQYEKAVTYYEQALTITKQISDRLGEAVSLNQLGNIYSSLGQYDKSNAYYNAALSIIKEIGNKSGESSILKNIGAAYDASGEKQKALEYYNRALLLGREIGDKYREAQTLNNIAAVYSTLGEKQKALNFYSQTLFIFKQVGDKQSEAVTLNNIAAIYSTLGEKEKAFELYNQSLIIFREISSISGEATALSNLGEIYDSLKDYKKSQSYYESALTLFQKSGDRRGEANTINRLGLLNELSEKKHEALKLFENALTLYQELNDTSGQATVLTNAGRLYKSLGNDQKALAAFNKAQMLAPSKNSSSMIGMGDKDIETVGIKNSEASSDAREYYDETLLLARKKGFVPGLANASADLMFYWQAEGNYRLAVYYGKQAANAFKKIRSESKADKSLQSAFLRNSQETFRTLTEILISEGRLLEAQTVLNLLKDEEYGQLARGGEKSDTIPYNQSEFDAIAKIDSLITLEREQSELRKQQKEQGEQFPADKSKRLEQIAADIKAANIEFDNALSALSKADASVKDQVADIQSEKNLQSALQNLGKELNTGAVALYTVIGTEDEKDASGKPLTDKTRSKFGWVILVTKNTRKAYPIDVTNLEQTVFQFKTALSSDKYDPKPLAQKLYNAIFRQTSAKQKVTLEQDLNDILGKYPDKTLMWSLDGVLRYIPMAALNDGSGYLVEKYRNVLFTKESLLWLMNQPKAKPETLGLGVSAGNKELNMIALPGVEKELIDIVRQPNEKTGISDGKRELNAQFKKQEILNLKDDDNPFQVVHIASHYSFNPTDQNASYLLVGDGKYTFGEMKTENNLFGTVDLLTLSACDTGVSGNGKEAEGFAYLAQSLGAKSVIASLWEVSDAGTPELMIRFYKLRSEHPEMSKGAAFREAQLAMLGVEAARDVDGKPAVKRSTPVEIEGATSGLPLYAADKNHPFAHPHYWAAFVLIGNWR